MAPGGWLLVEEGDFGLFQLAGPPDAVAATRIWHTMWSHPGAARIADAYVGRRVPGMVDAPGWDELGTACDTETAHRGDPAYEALRLAWPEYAATGQRLGIEETALNPLGRVFATLLISISLVAAWARCPSWG